MIIKPGTPCDYCKKPIEADQDAKWSYAGRPKGYPVPVHAKDCATNRANLMWENRKKRPILTA